MSVRELADAVDVTADQMQRYEAGERVGASTLFAIAKILEQPIGFFFEGLSGRDPS